MEHRLLEPGSTFAERYRIERYLAEGGFGAVYVAEQTATEAKVAIKVLWPQVLQSQDAVDKFRQEARIAGRVNSEHIVRIIDAGFDEATRMPFLAMELLHGEDLQRVIERGGPLSPEVAVRYLRHVASALDKAHGYKDKNGAAVPIVHRDLKPENLFLTHRENGEPLIKVLDFGIAKVLSGTSNMSQEVKGTPLFMAFEQATGGMITPQTDVWALGLIAFHLMTGDSYWRTPRNPDGSLMGLFGEVMQLPLDPPTQRITEFGQMPPWPPAFDQWFNGCVNRDPAQRFPSAGEAISALADALGVSIAASNPNPMSYAAPSGAWSTPQPAMMTPAVAAARSAEVVGPTLQSAGVSGSTAQGMAIPGATPATPKSGGKGLLLVALAMFLLLGIGGTAFVLTRGGGGPTAAASDEATPTAEPATTAASAPIPHATPEPPGPSAAPAVKPAPVAAEPTKPAPTTSATVSTPAPAPKPTATATAVATAATTSPSPSPKPKPAGKNDTYDDR